MSDAQGTAPVVIGLDRLSDFDLIVFYDTEFTCWEDSIKTWWADPAYPAEIIQVGLVVYDSRAGREHERYSRYVRPVINKTLSDYCKKLLHMEQATIDAGVSFAEASREISGLLGGKYEGRSIVTCCWGEDGPIWESNAKRNEEPNPIGAYPTVNLMSCASKSLGFKSEIVEREVVRRQLGLPDTPRTHDALVDAIELSAILSALRKYADHRGK